MDIFAEIGNRKVASRESLKEITPLPLPDVLFPETQEQAPPLAEPSWEEQMAAFSAGLARMKELYRPFLAEYAPLPAALPFRQGIVAMDFRYETEADRADIGVPLSGMGEWERVNLPDYRGPEGRWTAYYRATFELGPTDAQRLFLCFDGVDYRCVVTLNGRCVGRHEGFFAPFRFDVTDAVKKEGQNVLLVQVENDIATIGIDGTDLDGDKIYAATGLGWDDPETGWHHCPAGAGIWGDVWVEGRSEIYISDIFILPVPERGELALSVHVDSALSENVPVSLDMTIYPRNFQGEPVRFTHAPTGKAGHGENRYDFIMPFPEFRRWEPETPWMYTTRVALVREGAVRDIAGVSFGVREMTMVREGPERGEYVLNGRKLRLRGANEMGHLSRFALEKNVEGIFEDLMIARLGNLNFMRFTQRPMDKLTYDVCDRVGMLNQCDFPLFGYLRNNLYCEALRQVEEMERLIRNHPSVIAISYCNERFSSQEKGIAHRHMSRERFESWFRAADEVVGQCNPSRIIKRVEGDYDPPTQSGPPDFHCYNMWYTNHALPLGKLYKGFFPAVAEGWRVQCGEYGTEGLDHAAVMRSRYPAHWLKTDENGRWFPSQIVKAQTGAMHGDWYEEQSSLEDWIRRSQAHQAFATQLMTDAFRRRSDIMIGTAVHLLIDAWPAGWCKTLVGVDRIPKPGYFALQKSLVPLRLSLRCDRWKVYGGETLPLEVWLLNDRPKKEDGLRIVATLRDGAGREIRSYALDCEAYEVTAVCAGIAEIRLPEVSRRESFAVDAALLRGNEVLYAERFTVAVYPKREYGGVAAFIGDQAEITLAAAGIQGERFRLGKSYSALAVSDAKLWANVQRDAEKLIHSGARALFLPPEDGSSYELGGSHVEYKQMNGLFFVAMDTAGELGCFDADELSFWYDKEVDALGFIADRFIAGGDMLPLAFTYEKPDFFGTIWGFKKRLPVLGKMSLGKGAAYVSSIRFAALCGANPPADELVGLCLAFIG